jgi:ribosomal protein S18 acetylase RimI-like enzyme
VKTFINVSENEKYQRRRGYTEGISVRRPWRRRGLARALIVRSLRDQRDRGMTESALGVDSENISGATRVYEDCGFRPVRRYGIYRKPL